MKLTIVYQLSAFKHGVSKADIREAFDNYIYDHIMEEGSNRYLLIGFDSRGNLIEVMYNDLGGQCVNVFHAMKCRNTLLSLLDE